MHGLIIGTDLEFGGELVALVGLIENHTCQRHSVWQSARNIPGDAFDFVICHVNSKRELKLIFDFQTRLSEANPSPPVIVIGQEIDLESKIKLLKAGVFECLDRPINRQRIRYLIESIGVKVKFKRQRSERFAAAKVDVSRFQKQVRMIADNDANVLIRGETGVGKTFIAKQIHQLSDRRTEPFVSINCGAIPENLIESELFGHKKGTFTGADRDRTGKFEFAGKGTILLDEIDALPMAAQAKLLHVVDDRVFQPLGSNKTLTLDARILTATNRSLGDLIQQGQFRSDLFYRLDVFELEILSLRDRRDEIPELAECFASELAQKYKRTIPRFSTEVQTWMQNFDWPGNLRELKNCVEHALLSCEDGAIEMTNLPPRILAIEAGNPEPSADTNGRTDTVNNRKSKKKRIEIDRIINVLEQNEFNRTEAAKDLGISRAAFYKKLHTLGLL